MSTEYERLIEWYARDGFLIDKILEKIEEGWAVLYAIPEPQYLDNSSHQPYYQSYIPSTHTDANGVTFTTIPISNSTTAGTLMPMSPMIEVCYIKRNWQKDPCPRCSYPFPDPERVDREA